MRDAGDGSRSHHGGKVCGGRMGRFVLLGEGV
jgi:hypothetical protein